MLQDNRLRKLKSYVANGTSSEKECPVLLVAGTVANTRSVRRQPCDRQATDRMPGVLSSADSSRSSHFNRQESRQGRNTARRIECLLEQHNNSVMDCSWFSPIPRPLALRVPSLPCAQAEATSLVVGHRRSLFLGDQYDSSMVLETQIRAGTRQKRHFWARRLAFRTHVLRFDGKKAIVLQAGERLFWG